MTSFLDDFVFDKQKNAWITTDQDNTLVVVPVDYEKHKFATVDGSAASFLVAGDTSCAFGRTENDNFILYVTTNGGLSAPINDTTQGGKVVAIDTRGFLT